MDQYEEAMAHLETLESHDARLGHIIHVLLEQIEMGTAQENSATIRAELPPIDQN
jgi:hypothetical protein